MSGSALLGVNMRVTGHNNQGGRKYMEDVFTVAYQQTENGQDLEYAYIGIFDGHGGKEAAVYAKEKLMDNIVAHRQFFSDNDDLVLKAIREGFIKTQREIHAKVKEWPKTASGNDSTAGTTASVAFIRRGKIFIGHVGDSGIILGEQHPERTEMWRAHRLTQDHKPESAKELERIESAGGKVINKSGVPRVVWTRPQKGHTGPVRRSTHLDEVPFLAVARALGDIWSYNSKIDEFIVSPEPDLHVYDIDISRHRCLIFGTDGAWNVISPEFAVTETQMIDKGNEKYMMDPKGGHKWRNPAKHLVDSAINKWNTYSMRADNTTTVVVLLDPPGPPRAEVLRRQRELVQGGASAKKPCNNTGAPPLPPRSCSTEKKKPVSVISRLPNSDNKADLVGYNMMKPQGDNDAMGIRIVHDSVFSKARRIPVEAPVTPSSKTKQETVKDDKFQVNEVSSSDTKEKEAVSKQPVGRKSLSRELASLNIESPSSSSNNRPRRSTQVMMPSSTAALDTPDLKPKLRGRRSIEGLGHEDSDSETENNESMVPASKLAEVEKKCDDLTKRLEVMEAMMKNGGENQKQVNKNVKKASTAHAASPLRVLRARNSDPQASTSPSSATKRKHGSQDKWSGQQQEVPRKKGRRSEQPKEARPKVPEARATRRSLGAGGSHQQAGLPASRPGKFRRRKIY